MAAALEKQSWSGPDRFATSARYRLVPSVLRKPFVERWQARPEEARAKAEDLRSEIMAVVARRRPDEIVPLHGPNPGLVGEILRAAQIVKRLVIEAEEALERTRQPAPISERKGAKP